jgi:DNA-binding transcriptional LysR family regulator
MNDLQIDYFMAVATNLSFTKTSEELYVSQPAISKQISQLEKELGFRLFTRSNKKTELTEAGKLFYDLFSRYKADLIKTRIEAEHLMGSKSGLIRVGFLEGWDLSDIIPPMTEKYKEKHPHSEIVINCCGVKELSTLLLTDGLDIVVTQHNSVEKASGFTISDIADIGKILVYSKNHPLAFNKDLTLRDFCEDTFLAPWEIVDKMVLDALTSYTEPYGFTPKVRFVRNLESMITSVRNNMGVAFIDEWVHAKDEADLAWIPINDSDTISIVRLTNKTSDSIICMENVLKDVIGNISNQI